MRKYYDAEGNEIGSSQGLQGGGAQGCLTLFWLVVLVLSIGGIISAIAAST